MIKDYVPRTGGSTRSIRARPPVCTLLARPCSGCQAGDRGAGVAAHQAGRDLRGPARGAGSGRIDFQISAALRGHQGCQGRRSLPARPLARHGDRQGAAHPAQAGPVGGQDGHGAANTAGSTSASSITTCAPAARGAACMSSVLNEVRYWGAPAFVYGCGVADGLTSLAFAL